jgi:hypothetical protein
LSDISQVFSALFTNPLGVISALTNLDPTVTTTTSGLPVTVAVELTPALELALAQLGAESHADRDERRRRTVGGISVDPFGGLITELADTEPSQILAAL